MNGYENRENGYRNKEKAEDYILNLDEHLKQVQKNNGEFAENFVLEMLDYKKNGHYVELGAFHSRLTSNTYRLETEYDWKGVSFELNPMFHAEISANRRNECVFGDATQFNYVKYFERNNFPRQIDFLQIDIDSGYDDTGYPVGNPHLSLLGLIAIPLNTYRFSVITFEHDTSTYFKLESQREASREILDSLGYRLVVKQPHEDFWVDPRVVPYQKFMKHFNRG
jgi:hypothetical protein